MKETLFALWMLLWSLTFVGGLLVLALSPVVWLISGHTQFVAVEWGVGAVAVASLAMSPVTLPFMVEKSFG